MTGSRIHFYGDSYVAGFADPEGLGWVGRVAPLCAELDFANHGVPGETSLQAVTRFDNTLLDDRDAVAVFSFGTNDVILGVPFGESLRALGRALDRTAAHDIIPCVVEPPAIHGLPAADELLRELMDGFRAICDDRGVKRHSARELLAPNGRWYAQAAAFDGAHPQADGYAELADALVAAGFADWLAETSGR